MKAFLMHADRDFDAQGDAAPNQEALTQDLELTTLVNAMATGDRCLLEVARRAARQPDRTRCDRLPAAHPRRLPGQPRGGEGSVRAGR